MLKFSLQQKLNEVLLLQKFKANPGLYDFLKVAGHIGVDFSIGDGDKVPALFDGTIIYAQNDTIVQLTDHDSTGRCLEVSYGHGVNFWVKPGDKVKAGQFICRQGSSGPSVMWKDGDVNKVAWSHVHLGIREVYITETPPQKAYSWNYQQFSPIKYAIIESDPSMAHFIDPNIYNTQVIDTFIRGIANHEGFLSGASRVAVQNNNPGNLRYSPLQDGTRDGFAYFSTLEKGWQALRNDVVIKASGQSKVLTKKNATILDFCEVYAPRKDNNNPLAYAKSLVSFCGLRGVNDPLSDILLTEFEWLEKYNYTKFLDYPELNNKLDPTGNLAKLVQGFRYLWNVAFRDK
jgi:murein DD-endopeptidase MepM/ murein hydrolase activator NlpD